jgi:ATP-dependent helicase HrpB
LPPRLARMVLEAARQGDARTASEIAVLLTERGLGGDAVDLTTRLESFQGDRSQRAEDARRLARALASRAAQDLTSEREKKTTPVPPTRPGALLASAYPDRIAAARGKRGELLMANGRAAALETHDSLSGQPYLAIGEIAGRAAAARILLAAPLTLADLESAAGPAIETTDELIFDPLAAALRARRRRRLGALVLGEQTLAVPSDEGSALALARGVIALGLKRLPWTKALQQWRDRVIFLRRAEGDAWPDLSNEKLAADPQWLASFLSGKTRLSEIDADDLDAALRAALPFDLTRRLDEKAPSHFRAPTGTAAPIDYGAESGPAISLRVQELFGLNEQPTVAGGRISLTLCLLSPAYRPIQITRDLPGFWRGSWGAVRADLRGRYPRHLWPEDPAKAAPTSRAKPRGT